MRNFLFLTLVCLFLWPSEVISQISTDSKKTTAIAIGEDFSMENILSAAQMQERYDTLEEGDTVAVKFTAEVASVCKKKGCWMNLSLENGEEVMVKFKDYAFFVPKDIENKKVTVTGKAYVTEMSVADRQHYAQDAGKTSEEVGAIDKPAVTLSFLADGVKIQK